jgi:hypothetical protein
MMGELIPNRPTPQGIEAGRHVARLWRASMRNALIKAPLALAAVPDRCKTCAFREGTIPNGCEETILDAIKCVIEGVPFMCHETKADGKPRGFCSGWLVTQRANQERGVAPWEWTDPERANG